MSGDRERLRNELLELRHHLHTIPECAHHELETADTVAGRLQQLGPSRLIRALGGTGVAAVWSGPDDGPTVLLRAELDALPLDERGDVGHRSTRPGAHHACGHDGHMTILLGVGTLLASAPPVRGCVVALFQPAEETGEGAARVLADPSFSELSPDWAFAIHNLPGHPTGHVLIRDGCFAAGSAGLVVRLRGRTSHAAHPELGRSPASAAARLALDLEGLSRPADDDDRPLALCTVIHVRVGSPAFGTTPGDAEVLATVRSDDAATLARLRERCEELARAHASSAGLELQLEWREVFPTTDNHPEAVARVAEAARSLGLPVDAVERPFRWSEDFGHLTSRCRGALVGLGAGADHTPLHAPDYDFPDALLLPGVELLDLVVRGLVGSSNPGDA
jgi:amidohydrolase